MADPFPDPRRGTETPPLTRRQLREAERAGRRTPGQGVPQVEGRVEAQATRSRTAVEPAARSGPDSFEDWLAPEAPRTGIPSPTSSPWSGPVPTTSFEAPGRAPSPPQYPIDDETRPQPAYRPDYEPEYRPAQARSTAPLPSRRELRRQNADGSASVVDLTATEAPLASQDELAPPLLGGPSRERFAPAPDQYEAYEPDRRYDRSARLPERGAPERPAPERAAPAYEEAPTPRRGRRTSPATDEPEPEFEPEPAPGRRRWLGPLVAVTLLAWVLVPFVGLAHPLVVLLAASSPLAAVVGVPLAVLSLRSRRWITAGLATVAALTPWAMIIGYASPGPTPALGADAVQLRVMTVNAHLGQADAASVVEAVRNQAPDVVVITELTSGLAHDLTTAGIANAVTPQYVQISDDPAGGIGIFTRAGAKNANALDGAKALSGTRWPSASGTLQTDAGAVGITAAHVSQPIPTGSGAWAQDLATLAGQPASGAKREILVGDLNSTPWNQPYRKLLSAGWTDAADVLGHGMRPTWPQWSPLPLAPLDHVMVRGDVAVRSVGTVSIKGSDHRGLVVTLAVANQKASATDEAGD